ncbi:KH domain-containing protein [archaeon]|jgi:transcription antitermination factor NusA-like protein|nr:KH domain-containing protein [archaeon]MBT7128219.1 KH domain-containing protein [archaeon]
MAGVIDMQLMRYINLFARTTKVSTTKVFYYNNQIIFAVPKAKVSMAIGKGACNIKRMSETLRKKIRVVVMPAVDDVEGIKKFVGDVVAPIEFVGIEMKGGSIVVNAGRQSKAALIGRNRGREKELADVMKDFFGVSKLRIA